MLGWEPRTCIVVNATITDRTPMTAEEALAALKTGDPIHVQGEEMRRFITAVAPVTCRRKCHITDFGPCDDCVGVP